MLGDRHNHQFLPDMERLDFCDPSERSVVAQAVVEEVRSLAEDIDLTEHTGDDFGAQMLESRLLDLVAAGRAFGGDMPSDYRDHHALVRRDFDAIPVLQALGCH